MARKPKEAPVEEPEVEEEEEPTLVPEYHEYDVEEVIEHVASTLDERAAQFREEARLEDFKGNASQTKIGMLKWGADQLDAISAAVRLMERGETRMMPEGEPVEAPVDTGDDGVVG